MTLEFYNYTKTLNLTNFENESIQLVKWTGVKSVVLVIFTTFIGLVGMISKGLIIIYVLCFAPKNRPINTLMLFEQVSEFHAISQFLILEITPYGMQ